MKTPRLALVALCSLLASAAYAGEAAAPAAPATPDWHHTVQPHTAWTAISFKTEGNVAKKYWFRTGDKGNAVKLYDLKPEKHVDVKGSAYYTSVASGYTLKIVPSPRSYAVSRPGVKFTYTGTWAGMLAPAGTVVVAAPSGEAEKLDPTPISVFTPGLAPVTWNEYYYVRQPEKEAWYSGMYDSDGDYRNAKLQYGDMHARVIPFEYLFDRDRCFVRPEACVDPKKHKAFIAAAANAAKGNLLLLGPLAEASHKHYADEARKFKAALAEAPAGQFSEPENKLLERLLVDQGAYAAFQAELAKLKPEQQPLFVKKWRGYLKEEIDAYLVESEKAVKAGNKPVAHAALRTAMAARFKKAAALPLGATPPAAKPPAAGPGAQPAAPAARPLTKKDEAKAWNGAITSIGKWFEITTKSMPVQGAAAISPLKFYCYHDKMGSDKTLTKHLKAHALIAECTDWSAPASDAVQTEADNKFKVRTGKIVFNVAVTDIEAGRLRIVSDTGVVSEAGGDVTETRQMSAADIGGVELVKVTASPAPAAPSALPLSAAELLWLNVQDRALYRDKPKDGAIEPFRKMIAANLAEIEGAAAEYEAAVKDPKATGETIDAALAEPWGGKDNKTIVELSGTRLDIQLSPEDLAALKALPKVDGDSPFMRYEALRGGGDGRKEGADGYHPSNYNPVNLHKSVVDARAALETKRAILTEDEIKLLTPKEKELYDGYVARATINGKFDPTEKNLLDTAVLLRKRMNSEDPKRSAAKAPPSSAEMTAAQFDALPLFQKRQFCIDYPVPIGIIDKDTKAPPIDNASLDPNKGLENSAAAVKPKPETEPAKKQADTKWSKEDRINACSKLIPEIAGAINATDPKPKPEGSVGNLIVDDPKAKEKTKGPDDENPKKKDNEWLTGPLIGDAVKGGFLGLVIGSLFGPIGLIAGPLIGAAIFYGVGSPLMKKKDDE